MVDCGERILGMSMKIFAFHSCDTRRIDNHRSFLFHVCPRECFDKLLQTYMIESQLESSFAFIISRFYKRFLRLIHLILFFVLVLMLLALFANHKFNKLIGVYGLISTLTSLVMVFTVGGPITEWVAVFGSLTFVGLLSWNSMKLKLD